MPLAPWLALALFAATPSASTPDSSTADSVRAAPPVRRTFGEVFVRAPRFDPRSSETRARLDARTLRELPLDGLADALRTQAGVVIDGEVVHVRGARPGELSVELDGVTLNDPLRGAAPELPLAALEEAELLTGGLEASHAGGLAGTLRLVPADPTARWTGLATWQTDGRRSTHFDRLSARLAGPTGLAGIGVVASAEARLDDTHVPNLRTVARHEVLGARFGWRADNRLLGSLRIAPVASPSLWSLHGFASRIVRAPFDPMWSLRGWTTPCPDDTCLEGPAYLPTAPDTSAGLRWAPYNAADHAAMTDERRLALVGSASRPLARGTARATLAWSERRAVTSPDGTEDERFLALDRLPLWGFEEARTSDPFHVYLGDEPFFERSLARRLEARGEWERRWSEGRRASAGAAFTHERVEFRQIDEGLRRTGLDTLRAFFAEAPGAYAFAQGRWEREQLVVNAGVRAEWWTPGPAAREGPWGEAPRARVIVSPRVGLSFPLSPRDAFSIAYVRLTQPPAREFLYDNRRFVNNRHPLGNPALDPATAISYEASLRHAFDERWSGRASLFYRDLFRQVSARNFRFRVHAGPPLPSDYELRYASDDAGRASGLELALSHRTETSTFDVTYTWLETEGSESFEDGLPYYALLGAQPMPVAEHPLAWDQRHRLTLSGIRRGRHGVLTWTTTVGSGLPWTPATRRQLDGDLSRVHSRRFDASESTDLGARFDVPWTRRRLDVGLDVRNVFDSRAERKATADGWPNPVINSVYDDYGAFREETGLGGGAYWNDGNADGFPGWVRVHDPRLTVAPRSVRLSVGTRW